MKSNRVYALLAFTTLAAQIAALGGLLIGCTAKTPAIAPAAQETGTVNSPDMAQTAAAPTPTVKPVASPSATPAKPTPVPVATPTPTIIVLARATPAPTPTPTLTPYVAANFVQPFGSQKQAEQVRTRLNFSDTAFDHRDGYDYAEPGSSRTGLYALIGKGDDVRALSPMNLQFKGR